MSHEIRAPINTILGMNEMIGRKSDDNDILRYSRDIEHSGKLLLSIINDVLDFSKIEAGKMQLYPAPFDTAELFSDMSSLLSERAEAKGLSALLDISPDIPKTLQGDDVRIRQIIMNLITNAVKYTSSGSVSLKAKAEALSENDRVGLAVSVRDTGAGISEDDREKILKLIFKHTTTIGVRENISRRYTLNRRIEKKDTVYGPVRLKVSEGYGVTRSKWEYEDIIRIADEQGSSIEDVIKEITCDED